MEYNGAKYWYDKNLQGDIVGIRNSTGTPVAKYVYDAWGKILQVTDKDGNDVSGNSDHIANINPFRYRGYYYDVETGWYYLNARYYDPAVGRFLSPDGQINNVGSDLLGANLFAYCGNNPVNRIDPNGNEWWHWLAAATIVVGTAVALVISAGGVAPAVMAAASVANGFTAGSTTATIAAGALVGASTAMAASTISSIENSDSLEDFADKGQYAVTSTFFGGAIGALSAYSMTRTPKTKMYRSVSQSEADSIKQNKKFIISDKGMDCKQFGLSLSETKKFGEWAGQDIVVSVKVPNYMLTRFCNQSVDSMIFKHGTVTVYSEYLNDFNNAISGTIKFH